MGAVPAMARDGDAVGTDAAKQAGEVALSVLPVPAFLCRFDGEVTAHGSVAASLLPPVGSSVHATLPTLDLERTDERQVVRVIEADRRRGRTAHARVRGIGDYRLVVLEAIPEGHSSHALVEKLQAKHDGLFPRDAQPVAQGSTWQAPTAHSGSASHIVASALKRHT